MKKLTLWLSMTGILALAAFDQRGPGGPVDDAGKAGDRAGEAAQNAERDVDARAEEPGDSVS